MISVEVLHVHKQLRHIIMKVHFHIISILLR